jgi:hypothetical protein
LNLQLVSSKIVIAVPRIRHVGAAYGAAGERRRVKTLALRDTVTDHHRPPAARP